MDPMTDEPGPPRRRLGGILVDPAPLRLDRDYRLLWIGQAISVVGRMITAIVFPYQVYVLTNDLLSVGALSLVQLVPILIFALGGGAVADAVDRRRLLIVTQLGLAACSLALAVIALTPAPPIAAIFAVAFVAAGLGAIDSRPGPRRSRGLSPSSGCRRRSASTSWCSTAPHHRSRAAVGIVLASRGVSAAYLIDVVTFAAAIVALC